MLVRMGGNLPEETWLQGVLEEGYREAGAEDKFPPRLLAVTGDT